MLPKQLRIARKDFPQIIVKGKKYNSPLLLLNMAKIEGLTREIPSKFSFSASKKISKKAIVRNKLRRRGYSVISKVVKNIKPGYFFFFMYKKGSETASFDEIEKDILKLLSESFVLK